MSLKFSCLARRFVVLVGLFLCAGAAVGDTSNKNYLINGSPFNDTVCWNVTLKAGSAGGLFGDTMGPVRTFRYETVVEVDGKETLVIPGGIYSTDMGSDAASYTVQIPLKDLGILKNDTITYTYHIKAYTRSYEGDSDVDIGYSLLYASDTVTVEYVGIVLTASDGAYEEYVKVEWKDKLSGETYHLCRDTQTIATGLTGSVYFDETAEPGKKYLYQVIAASGRESNTDEGYRRIIKPKLKQLVLKGVDIPGNMVAVTSITNFLVAGNTITAEAEVLNYDEKYFDLKSAKLIGTPKGGPATRKHECLELHCDVKATEHFAEGIEIKHSLKAQDGFHGNYEWKVEAEFLCKIDGTTFSEKSSTTNAPVFFKKYGEDQVGIPNWFTYWGQDGACPTLKKCQDVGEVVYDPNKTSTYAEWSRGDNKIYMSKRTEFVLDDEEEASGGMCRLYEVGPAGFHYPKPIVLTNKTNQVLSFSFGGLSVYGINTVEEVLAHELFHKQSINFYNDYDASSDFASKLGFRLKDDDKDDSRPPINNHKFCDFLLNCQEESLRYYELNTKDTDTYNTKNKNQEYEAYGDNEFVAMVTGAGANDLAVVEKDWAFPGHQSCLPELYSGLSRKKTFNKRLSSNMSLTKKYGNYEANVKENGVNISFEKGEDGKIAVINCVVALECTDKKNKYLQGVIEDENGSVVSVVTEKISADNGVVALKTEGRKIYESGKNGPYKLTRLSIMEFDGSELYERCLVVNYSNITINVERNDLSSGNAYLLDVAGETVITNGIEVPINAEINIAGGYEIFATLAGTNGMPVATYCKAMDCSVGTNCFKMVFAASDILKSGVDGPYIIDNLALFKDGVRIDSRLDYSILRKNYRADAFDFEEGEEINSDQFMSQFGDYTPPPKLPPVKTHWVIFNPNGGTTSETIREVKSGDEIGDLPIPKSGNDEFLGWYTELEGGTRISNATIITTNVLYHARWQEIPDEVAFTASRVNAQEGEAVVISIAGGNEDFTSSVQLYGVYNTAAAADIDLAKTLVDGKPVKGFKFPYTLSWAAGEYTNRTVTLFTKADKSVEGNEFLTLQLANPVGINIGENDICTVTIEDVNTYATLQDGIMNPNIKVSTKGDGKWTVGEGSNSDESGVLGMYHAESPSLAQGKSSTLSFATVKGNGEFNFYVRFVGDPNEMIPSELSVYNGKKLIWTIDHTQVTNVWEGYTIIVSGGSASAPNTYNFVFTQGSDPNTHVEISDISWDNGSTTPVYNVIAWEDGTEGGYVSGSGPYLKGQTAKLIAKPLPGWAFDGWYEVTLNEENDDLEYALFGEKATVSFKPTRDIFLMAFFKKIPYIRGLADPADGGKVTGSGLCAAGKKVTLRASANKNFTFKGWHASLADNPNAIDETKCVATTASLVIDRTSKPMANSKTSTTITGIRAGVTYFAVFEGDPRVAVSVNPAPEAGKVTGVGRYAPGKKVTVKATANKGYVFNGWYLGERCITQAANYAFTMPEEDVALYAKFVTAEEDAASIALSVDALGGEISPEAIISVTNTCGVALKWSVAADAFSQPKVTVSGLPAGLKFTAKDIMKKGSKTEVEIPANTVYGTPTAESRLDAKTGLRKPSAVKFTVTTAGKSKRVYPVEMTVLPLPAWAVGTFNGGGDYGQVSLTVAKTGKLSGKYLSDGLTWSLAANSFDSIDESGEVYRATLIGKSGKLAMTNEVGVACDSMGGFAESIDYIAYQNNWKLEPWKTIGKPFAKAAALEYEDAASVEGEEVPGVISLKFAAAGTVKVTGSFVVGINERTGKEILYKASGSAVLAPQTQPDENGAFEGVVFVYFPPKAGKFDGYVRCLTVRWDGEVWSVSAE